ncbi:MAG: FHA domain-containing protein [Chloroflexi bacterium]|nr:MAG: FHA domain-containing protein [Chloroflexota bacterium]
MIAAGPAQRRAGPDGQPVGDRQAGGSRVAGGGAGGRPRDRPGTDQLDRPHTFRGRSWYVEDQGSTNGTYVNGHRIDRAVALSFGDELSIGRVRMRLER